jgi:hypothetical protein
MMLHPAAVRLTLLKPLLILALLAVCLLSSGCGLLFAKMAFGCLPEGTTIDTPGGPVPVEQLRTGDQVTGYHGKVVTVQQIHQYQENAAETRHLAVTFANGSTVRLSPRHRIHGTPAANLKPGDRLGVNTVAEVVPFGDVARSFDLLTDDSGYRIQGIPVNSMIEEMAKAAYPTASPR